MVVPLSTAVGVVVILSGSKYFKAIILHITGEI